MLSQKIVYIKKYARFNLIYGLTTIIGLTYWYYYDRVVPQKSNYDRQVPHAFRML